MSDIDNIKGTSEIWDINKLHNWDKNPRSINVDDFDRLKKQIVKFGQYKPLLITPDGEVIGGNMRLKALLELGVEKVWVNIVTLKDENEKMELSLSDNDRAGYYDSDNLANMLPQYDIDWKNYSVDFNVPFNLAKFTSDEFDANAQYTGMPEFGDLQSQEAYKTIMIHFQNEDDVRKFFETINQKYTEKTKFIWFPMKEKEKSIDKIIINES